MKLLQLNSADTEVASPDLVVLGAGGAGMACALFAALEGASVLLVEASTWVGGTTALSAGSAWVPGTQVGQSVNPTDTQAQARSYLDQVVGDQAPAALREAFLREGAAAIATLMAHTDVQFRPYVRHPDYQSDEPGSTLNGRALEPLPLDGRQLGRLFALVRPPIPEFTVLGGMMVDRTDINHLLGMKRSWASLRHALKILSRYGLDRLSHPRGTRLVMGNALVGRLLLSLSRQDRVSLALSASVSALGRDETGRVNRVSLTQNGQTREVKVRAGVVLASGGFTRHPALRQALLPDTPGAWSPSAPTARTAPPALELALSQGARMSRNPTSPAFWAPVSLRPRSDGSTAAFPHFVMDRAKPGVITVNQAGERFLNESTSYHLFGLAMRQAHRQSPSIPAWLVCDAAALRAYGLGMVRPGGKGLQPFLDDGYLRQGATLDELAVRIGVPAQGLRAAVAQNNAHATNGVDPLFERGRTAYQNNLGDPLRGRPNPNLGPLTEAPFFAVQLVPGDIGASDGLVTDATARVINAQGQPMAGLYAVGNDMQSIMGGAYPGPGITIGPGLVFARIAALDALAQRR